LATVITNELNGMPSDYAIDLPENRFRLRWFFCVFTT